MSDHDSGEIRICSGCDRALPIDEFGIKDRATGLRRTRCRDCVRTYSQAHYQEHRESYIRRAKASNHLVIEAKRAIVARMRCQPCHDCRGTFPPYCMEFDHRSGRDATGRNSPEAIANAKNSNHSVSRLEAELARCDVVCANCHAIRTHQRKQAEQVGVVGVGVEPTAS